MKLSIRRRERGNHLKLCVCVCVCVCVTKTKTKTKTADGKAEMTGHAPSEITPQTIDIDEDRSREKVIGFFYAWKLSDEQLLHAREFALEIARKALI